VGCEGVAELQIGSACVREREGEGECVCLGEEVWAVKESLDNKRVTCVYVCVRKGVCVCVSMCELRRSRWITNW